jgi:hypothetical protein
MHTTPKRRVNETRTEMKSEQQREVQEEEGRVTATSARAEKESTEDETAQHKRTREGEARREAQTTAEPRNCASREEMEMARSARKLPQSASQKRRNRPGYVPTIEIPSFKVQIRFHQTNH